MDISDVHTVAKTMETGDLTNLPQHPQVSWDPEQEGTYGGSTETMTNNKCAADERPLRTARAPISHEEESKMTTCPDSPKRTKRLRTEKGTAPRRERTRSKTRHVIQQKI
jgi:hypothetical protein